MKRAFFQVMLSVAIATVAHAGTLIVTPDSPVYTVGQTITLTVVGNSQGGTATGIWGRLLYSAALTNPSGITPTQNIHTTSGGGSAIVGPLRQGEGYAGSGFSDAFNQQLGTDPVSVGENTTSTIKVIAAANGTLNFSWEVPTDGLGNHLVYFGATPPTPAATVTIGPFPDADGDGIPNAVDKCMLDSRNAAAPCDTDCDGYGNVCDGDFNQSGTVNSADFGMFFVPSLNNGVPSSRGTDMNCNGTVSSTDFGMFFVPRLNTGVVGPSGLACAGQPGCGC
jgi:hypothetical protein